MDPVDPPSANTRTSNVRASSLAVFVTFGMALRGNLDDLCFSVFLLCFLFSPFFGGGCGDFMATLYWNSTLQAFHSDLLYSNRILDYVF